MEQRGTLIACVASLEQEVMFYKNQCESPMPTTMNKCWQNSCVTVTSNMSLQPNPPSQAAFDSKPVLSSAARTTLEVNAMNWKATLNKNKESRETRRFNYFDANALDNIMSDPFFTEPPPPGADRIWSIWTCCLKKDAPPFAQKSAEYQALAPKLSWSQPRFLVHVHPGSKPRPNFWAPKQNPISPSCAKFRHFKVKTLGQSWPKLPRWPPRSFWVKALAQYLTLSLSVSMVWEAYMLARAAWKVGFKNRWNMPKPNTSCRIYGCGWLGLGAFFQAHFSRIFSSSFSFLPLTQISPTLSNIT